MKPLERLAITINYTSAPVAPTVHMGSRTTSYIMRGVTNASSNFSKAFRENHWFNIAAVDVFDATGKSIAIIGNSITDGKIARIMRKIVGLILCLKHYNINII